MKSIQPRIAIGCVYVLGGDAFGLSTPDTKKIMAWV